MIRVENLLLVGEVSLYVWPPVWCGLDLIKQVNMLLIQHKQISWIQTNNTGGQPYSDSSPDPCIGLIIQQLRAYTLLNLDFDVHKFIKRPAIFTLWVHVPVWRELNN